MLFIFCLALICAYLIQSIKIKARQLARTTCFEKERLSSDLDWHIARNGEVIQLGTPPERGRTTTLPDPFRMNSAYGRFYRIVPASGI